MLESLRCAGGVVVVCGLLAAVPSCANGDGDSFDELDNVVHSGKGRVNPVYGPSQEGDFRGPSNVGSGAECAEQQAPATYAKRPVDIIFAIDNSSSMSDEIAEVEKQINTNFASIIDASPVDYRVIMLSRHGDNTTQRICVRAPLSGTNCDPVPDAPAETARFFQYSKFVTSYNALCRIVDSFDKPDDFNEHPAGYGELLRPDAFKVIVVISDDRVSTAQPAGCYKPYDDENSAQGAGTASTSFENDLLSLPGHPFGTQGNRNYVFHSIVGVNPFDEADLSKAYPWTAPISTGHCGPTVEHAGTGYQALSMKTGGLRYPTCGLDYTTIFREIAKGVIDGATVACELPIPAAPQGQTLDLSTVVPRYSPGGTMPPVDFGQVPNAGACQANKFYIEGEKIKLCPATCAEVQANPNAGLKVFYGCAVKGAN